jgi:hypothetical protein
VAANSLGGRASVRILGHSTMVSRDVRCKITEFVATATSDPRNVLELMPGRSFALGAIPNASK